MVFFNLFLTGSVLDIAAEPGLIESAQRMPRVGLLALAAGILAGAVVLILRALKNRRK